MRQRLLRGAACLAGLLLMGGSAHAQDKPPAEATPPAPGSEPGAAAGSVPSAAPNTAAAAATSGTPTGFSWSGAPKAKRARRAMARVDLSRPIATYPGFRMLPGGRSEVWLRLSQPVVVRPKRANRRVTYFIPGAQVGVRNNTNPLVTTHFNSPISEARLRPVRGGAELVVELREDVQPVHTVAQEPGGTMLLRVAVGKAARNYASQSQAPVPRSSVNPTAPNANGASTPREAPPIMVLPEAGPQL